MPVAHRNDDSRFCGAITKVSGQSTVFVNGKLWAVQGDRDTHCDAGALKAIYSLKNIYIENKHIICAVGDEAAPDYAGCVFKHPTGATNPKTGSPDVYVYGGVGGGTVT